MVADNNQEAHHNLPSTDDQIEEHLISACSGDMEAFARLYEETKSSVYGFALSILKNTTAAEDTLQDTYLRIHGSCYSYHTMGKPMAWILTITRNLALMKLRENRHVANMPGDIDFEAYFARTPAIVPEDRLILRAALEELSSRECQIIMLHAVTGFKHREIAKLLDLPLSTVLSGYNRGCKKLKRLLTEEGHHEEGIGKTVKDRH